MLYEENCSKTRTVAYLYPILNFLELFWDSYWICFDKKEYGGES